MAIQDKEKSFFKINGYNFNVSVDSSVDNEINLVKNRMFVPRNMWGYNDIQWTNFSGEDMTLTIFSRIYETYTGEKTQPEEENMGISDFYDEARTPHAVLKYWSQNFVPCVVVTDLQSFNNGTYVIDSLKQSNPTYDMVQSDLTLVTYENPEERKVVYFAPLEKPSSPYDEDTSFFSALALEVMNLGYHTQTCACTNITPADDCIATVESEVETIQKLLQKWGYFPNYTRTTGSIKPNGRFCYHTTQALKKFQEDEGIPVSGDFSDETRSRFLKRIVEE